jgi:hypothetical protein
MNYKYLFGFCVGACALGVFHVAGGMYLAFTGAGAASSPFGMVGLCWTGMAVLAAWTGHVSRGQVRHIEQLERRLQETGSAPLA